MVRADYYTLLRDFADQKIDILAGTQILAKGLHFPNVTLVGVISADTSLYVPDFRANEKTYQLISQVAGRTGRSEKKGTVYLQTFMPDQPAIRFAQKGDFHAFVTEELKHRKLCSLPPYGRLAVLLLRGAEYESLLAAANQAKNFIDQTIDASSLSIKVRGPQDAPISRIQRSHRIQIILQSPSASHLITLFNAFRASNPVKSPIKAFFDMDPVSLL